MSHRVSMIAPLPPYRGGIAQFATCSWEALEAAGDTVQGVSFSRQYPGLLFPGKSQLDADAATAPGPVLRSIDTVNPLSWSRTAREVAAFEPDLLFFHYWMPFFAPAFGSILRKVRKERAVRAITLAHNAVPHERRPLDRPLGNWFLKENDGFIVLSEEVERDLWTLGMRQPVRRIHHPVYDRFGPAPERSHAREELGIARDTPLVLFFGLVRQYKGLEVLLEAVAEARRKLPELRLIVAGEFYESEAAYRNQIARLGIARAVDVRNRFIPDREVATLFAAADVVAQPYLTASQSGVAQVAFHFDRPVILTDVGGLAEVVPDGVAGLVVPPGDTDALAEAIHRFFQEQMAAALTEGVRRHKAQFSWERLTEAFHDLAGD